MSENENKELVVKSLLPAVSNKDLEDYLKFKEEGSPGIGKVSSNQLDLMREMYLEGSSLREISNRLRLNKNIVFYMAERYKWQEELVEKIQSMALSRALKMDIYQNQTPDFYVSLGNLIRKNLQKSVDQYMTTKDPRILDSMNLSLIDKAVKIDTFLKESTGQSPKDSPPPSAVFNIMGNATIQKEEPAIDVTPVDSAPSASTADVLRAIADLKRKKATLKK